MATDRERVVELIARHPGMTAVEIGILLGKKSAGSAVRNAFERGAATRKRVTNERYPYAGTWVYYPRPS